MLQFRLQVFEASGVLVLPQEIAAFWPIDRPAVLVRFLEPQVELMRVKYLSRYSAVLEQRFEDIDPSFQVPFPSSTVYTKAMAAELAAFLLDHKDKAVVLHCGGGQSRAPGAALAWLEHRNHPQADVLANSPSVFQPNMHVHCLLTEALWREEMSRDAEEA